MPRSSTWSSASTSRSARSGSRLARSRSTQCVNSASRVLSAQIAWNIAAQAEARKHVLTKLFGGRRYTACYALAATIFLLGLNRDALYQQALRHQPVSESLQYAEVKILAAVLFAIGSTLVLTSMWQLGITGTFLGD